MAEPMLSVDCGALSGSRFQRYSTIITPTNERALSMKAAPAPTAATTSPPSAGPTDLARLKPAEFSEIAAGSSDLGTSSGMMACHAGPFIVEPKPRAKVSHSKVHGPVWPVKVSAPRIAAAANIHP